MRTGFVLRNWVRHFQSRHNDHILRDAHLALVTHCAPLLLHSCPCQDYLTRRLNASYGLEFESIPLDFNQTPVRHPIPKPRGQPREALQVSTRSPVQRSAFSRNFEFVGAGQVDFIYSTSAPKNPVAGTLAETKKVLGPVDNELRAPRILGLFRKQSSACQGMQAWPQASAGRFSGILKHEVSESMFQKCVQALHFGVSKGHAEATQQRTHAWLWSSTCGPWRRSSIIAKATRLDSSQVA